MDVRLGLKSRSGIPDPAILRWIYVLQLQRVDAQDGRRWESFLQAYEVGGSRSGGSSLHSDTELQGLTAHEHTIASDETAIQVGTPEVRYLRTKVHLLHALPVLFNLEAVRQFS